VWNIATSLLHAIAIALVVYGALIVLSAWLAGPTRSATFVRKSLAPALRDRPGLAYGTVGGVLLLVVIWGPTPAFRQFAWIALIAALLALGVTALRRQTAVEFAGVHQGDAFRELRERRSQSQATRAAAQPATVAASDARGGNGGHVAELERLATLHDRGALTDAEFESEKTHLLNGV
jgi:Short C-terminal domain